MANRSIKSIVFIVVLLSIFVSILSYEPLTFEQRVKAQEAIERVYYNHRIWPKENKDPKPPFEKMVPKEVIEKKVEDYLKKSSALETYWYRPITGEQLQAEMDRMAKNTKDPKVLNELFEALNNNPYLIAECLARPVLADRLIRNWYANDERFHKKTKEMAEEALRHLTPENFCSYPEGEHFAITYKLQIDGKEELYSDPEDHSIKLPEKEFYRIYDEIPEEGKISGVIERQDSFRIVLAKIKNHSIVKLSILYFSKVSCENYLKNEFTYIRNVSSPIKSELVYSIPSVGDDCFPTWQASSFSEPYLSVPQARYDHTAVWTGAEMVIWGGMFPHNTELNSGGRYNPATDSWVPTSQNEVPSARRRHTAIWTGSEMIVWGGYAWDGHINEWVYFNTGGRYNPITNSWQSTSIGENVPLPMVGGHSAVWTGLEMIIWGKNGGGRYKPDEDIWIPISTGENAPLGRLGQTAIWTGSEMIIWGGKNYSNSSLLNTGARYNPITDTWAPTAAGENCPVGRYNHTAIWTGTHMIIWGGEAKDFYYSNSGGRYNPITDTWLPTAAGEICPVGRYNHTAIWTGTEMIIWGGEISNASPWYTSSGGKYDPLTDSWLPTSIGLNVPKSRYKHTVVWTGSEMIVWGGGVASGPYSTNTGGRYNPINDTWVPTSTGLYIPSERRWHKAVWTGAEMVIWGGNGGDVSLNTGGRYILALDEWFPTSINTNTPTPRWGHTAIWTGTEMIIWGGGVSTGGKYNPVTDSWEVTQLLNAPSGNYGHSAVWSGQELIVWGGSSGSLGCLNSGGRYNPTSDIWTPTSTVNAPAKGCHHTAIWTGEEMIVWGGYGSPNARYNPVTDYWRNLSSVNQPTNRLYHTAVWTGTEMIIWGGSESNTGGCYNPATDTWVSTSVGLNVPEGRSLHTAVWNGKEMIIWGGSDDYTNFNNGGRYNPRTDSWIPTPTDSYLVPEKRNNHTAVWTEDCMIVWGGYNSEGAVLNSGGILQLSTPIIYGNATNLCPAETVLLSTSSFYLSYQWYRDNIPIDGATSNTYEATVSGDYTVSITDSSSCSGTSDPFSVTIVNCIPEIIYDSKGSFTEVTGDGDGNFEKGEKWKVSVTVRNSGNTPATNVVANLTGNGIQVCNNPGVFGTIPAGGTASYEFEFLIDSNFSPCGGYVDFGLINKQCVEKTPAGSDEFNLFSIQVGEITSGVPTEEVLNATEDSWVNQALMYADTNYGSDTSLYNQQRTSQARRALIQFGLTAIPSGSVINSATLEMYATSATGNPQINLHRVTSSWTESGVTWNNQPSYDAAIVSSLTSSGTGWKVWDVKSLIEGYLNGTYTNDGFLLKCNTETGTTTMNKVFASRENSNTSQRPVLRINYTPPPAMSCNYVGNGECLIPLPGEVAPGDNYNNALIWSEDKATINWPAVSGVTSYKVYRGIKSSLPALLTSAIDSCLRYQGTNTSVDLSSDNPSSDSDKMYWYLVIGSNSSGDGPAGNGRIINSGGSCQ
jgi:N-acetylneuraminic acid mutarotase